MKISRIYSNIEGEFSTIDFCSGFNVILGRIFHPENLQKDAHNLGKSKLAELIDFCLLKGRSKEFFLFKFPKVFSKYVFFLEVRLNSGGYITIRRSVAKNTKISIIKHGEGRQCFRGEGVPWDYEDEVIDTAKLILDSYFDFSAIGNWGYRDAIGYSLRSQDDYAEVFKLDKFRGRHIHWKPYLGKILGFDSEALRRNYELKSDIESVSEKLVELKKTIGSMTGDQQEILTQRLLTNKEIAASLQWQMDNLNFDKADAEIIEELTAEIDLELVELNRMKYYLTARLKKLDKTAAVKGQRFDIESVALLFQEAGVLFGEQIKKSYEELSEFNRLITTERQGFVSEQKEELQVDLQELCQRIDHLNKERSLKLAYLSTYDVLAKYKEVSNRFFEISAAITEINKKLEVSAEIKRREKEQRSLSRERLDVIEKIRVNREEVVANELGVYSAIKEHFNSYVSEVLNKNGVITTEQNDEGNLEYYAGLIGKNGEVTGESDGHSYKKILCIGFDLAVVSSYADSKFIRFLYHDGGLETLDDRKKTEFIDYVRTASNVSGFQYILTTIETDLPAGFKFASHEIIRVLHDDGPSGRLFNIPQW